MQKMSLTYNTIAISFEKAFLEFQRYNYTKNLSEKSIAYYDDCYKYFTNFFNEKKNCNLITKDTFQDYIIYLQQKTNANENTINSYLRGLRAMLNYFMELGYVEPFSIKLPKVEQKIKVGFTDRELEILLKKPDVKKCSFTELRNCAIENYLLRYWKQAFYCL